MKLNKDRTGEIRLSSGHTLIAGHKPLVVPTEDFRSKLNGEGQDILSFGLFETASPNYATYYPDVQASDLNPQENEFIYPVFRMLSETIVSKGAPIDFSQGGVLKKSMAMLLGQTINIDHEMAIGNAVGAVKEVFWQESYKSNGIQVPAGINAVMMIDGKSNPRIARGVMMNPPSIHSNSVTVRFGWKPSHKFEDEAEFFDKVGSYDKKGELIRAVVDEIRAYNETSLVSHGADPYAQKVNSKGEINNPKYASKVYSFSAGEPITGFFELDYKTENFSLSADKTIPKKTNNISNNDNQQNMDEIIKDLVSELGFKDGDLTEENLVTKLKAKFEDTKNNRTTEVENLTTERDNLLEEVGTLKTDKADIQGKLDKIEENNTLLEQITKNTRTEAVKFYKLIHGEEADENIINLISDANFETANSFRKQYQREADEKFEATCDKCGSKEVSRASAKSSTDGLVDDKGKTKGGGPKTSEEVRRTMLERGRKKSLIFKERKD